MAELLAAVADMSAFDALDAVTLSRSLDNGNRLSDYGLVVADANVRPDPLLTPAPAPCADSRHGWSQADKLLEVLSGLQAELQATRLAREKRAPGGCCVVM